MKMMYDYETLTDFQINSPSVYFNWWSAGRTDKEINKHWDIFIHELSEFTDYLITKNISSC